MVDFSTCTATFIIRRSITLHPSILAASLRKQAEQHRDYVAAISGMASAHFESARSGALAMARDCEDAARYVEDGLEPPRERIGLYVCAFNAAATLQLIPRHLRAAMIEREA